MKKLFKQIDKIYEQNRDNVLSPGDHESNFMKIKTAISMEKDPQLLDKFQKIVFLYGTRDLITAEQMSELIKIAGEKKSQVGVKEDTATPPTTPTAFGVDQKNKLRQFDAVKVNNVPAGDPGAKYNNQAGQIIDVDKNTNSATVKFKDNQAIRFNTINPFLKKSITEPAATDAKSLAKKVIIPNKPGQISVDKNAPVIEKKKK